MNMREPQSLTHMEWEKHMKYKIKGFIYMARRAKHHRRRFLSGKILYTTNGISTFNMERKLLICGDVLFNPGPKGSNSKHYCIECRKKVRRNQDAII